MVYKEYKKASLRHLSTCLNTCSYYDTISDPLEKNRLLIDTYYLAGYIYECIFSYTIFSLIGFDKSKNVYKLKNDNNCGLFFSKDFQSHKLTWKIDYLTRNGGTGVSQIPILNGSSRNRLLKKWDVKYRYSIDFSPTIDEVRDFVNLANNTVNLIRIHITKD